MFDKGRTNARLSIIAEQCPEQEVFSLVKVN